MNTQNIDTIHNIIYYLRFTNILKITLILVLVLKYFFTFKSKYLNSLGPIDS